MTLTKKHFNKIAEIINKNRIVIDTDCLKGGRIEIWGLDENLINDLSDYLDTTNPKFDIDKFKEACLK